MAVTSKEPRVKFRLKYEKGSQTFSQCDQFATDESLYVAATTLSGLRKDKDVEITKITEADLIQE